MGIEEHEELLDNICGSVIRLDKDKTLSCVKQAVKQKISPHSIIDDGLCKGIQIIGKKCEAGDVFIPQLAEFSDLVDAAMTVLTSQPSSYNGMAEAKIILGVVHGDIHEIGKNILGSALAACGFHIIDLGKDVPSKKFVEAALQEEADVICLSTYLTTTMAVMKDVLDDLKSAGVRDRIKVVVGGEPVCENFAKNIGADGYAPNAATATNLIRDLLNQGIFSSDAS